MTEKHYVDQPPPVASPPFGALRHHLQPLAAPIFDPDLQSQPPTTTFSGKAAVKL